MAFLIILVGLCLLAAFFWIFLLVSRRSPESTLLEAVTRGSSRGTPLGWRTALGAERWAQPLTRLRSLFAAEPKPEVVQRLVQAGFRKPYHADVLTTARLLLPVIAGLTVAYFVHANVFFWFLVAVVGAFLLPEFWLSYAIRKRLNEVKFSLPDALDLLSICVEAGLGLDQAIQRVGNELSVSHPEVSEEFILINLEQRAGNPRLQAWRNMAQRIPLESIRSFVNMLAQTERFGTPISKALATFSDSLRTKRRQEAEELAAKTTIKLVLPLVFFIFPCIFIVTVAPAIITLIKNFSTILK